MSHDDNIIHGKMPDYSDKDPKNNIILNLHNFRTYGVAEVTIPINSTTLIVGQSGVGKTSIFEAFIYILFNGIQKPEKFGTKRCWGWLSIGGLIIYRQKDPGLLKLWKDGKSYTGGDAQYMINEKFGSQNVFIATSYLRQKEFSPFFYGSDKEKMDIIKSVAFKGSESDEIKEPIKRKTQELQQALIGMKAQLDMAIKNIEIFDRSNPTIVKQQIPENSADVLKEVQSRRNLVAQIDQQYEQVVRQEANISVYKQQADKIQGERDIIKKTIADIDTATMSKRIREIEAMMDEYKNFTVDAEKLAAARLFALWKSENDRLHAKVLEGTKNLDTLKKSIETLYSEGCLDSEHEEFIKEKIELAELITKTDAEQRMILSHSNISNISEAKVMLETLESELKDEIAKTDVIRNQLKEIRAQNKMTCPSCKDTLIFAEDGKTLEKLEGPSGIGAMLGKKEEVKEPKVLPNISQDDLIANLSKIENLKHQIESYNKIISSYEEKSNIDLKGFDKITILSSVDSLKKYIPSLKLLENTEKALADQNLGKPNEVEEPPQQDTGERDRLETEKAQLNRKIQEHGRMMERCTELDKTYSYYTQQVVESMNGIKISSADLKAQKGILQQQIDQLMHLSSSSDLIAQRVVLEKTMKEKAQIAENTEKRALAVQRLMSRAIEAERIFLQTSVDQINVLVGKALQKLFPDTPISVELSTTKQLKSKKNSVSQRFDLKIFYRDAEYSSSKQLSGGEKDRVSLAITLAMNQTFGSPILFLDETLSSLDPELKSEAVALLKDISKDRTCVVISHEETEGLYDNVIHTRT